MRASKTTPDGIEIIAREPALGESPNPTMKGKLVPFNGVSKLLLADDTETYECDHCGKIFPTVKQVISHSTHHYPTTKRSTEVETIKLVLRTLAYEKARAKADGRKSYQQETADELNRRGIKTYRGKPWTVGAVYAIFNAYHKTYRIRTPRIDSTPKSTAPVTMAADAAVLVAPAKKVKAPTPVPEDVDRRLFNGIMKNISALRQNLDRIETDVLSLEDRLRSKTDVPLDKEALNALELLRRAWQQS